MARNQPEPSPGRKNKFGRSSELSQLYIVALYEPETGEVLLRHSVAVVTGGKEISEGSAVEAAYARARAFYERIEKDSVQMKKYATIGKELFPLDRLKVAVSNNPEHLDMELRVDPKSGKLVEASDEEKRSPQRTKQSS